MKDGPWITICAPREDGDWYWCFGTDRPAPRGVDYHFFIHNGDGLTFGCGGSAAEARDNLELVRRTNAENEVRAMQRAAYAWTAAVTLSMVCAAGLLLLGLLVNFAAGRWP